MMDHVTIKKPLYIPYAAHSLLELPLLNKGAAFSIQERNTFNLHGLIPHVIETIEEQSRRSYQQYLSFNDDINKHIYLRNIQDTNETLFYHLLKHHLSEMMPIIYTPASLNGTNHIIDKLIVFIATNTGVVPTQIQRIVA
jgi:malate dehydrogenase (oxaloacetate-decarboxylating)